MTPLLDYFYKPITVIDWDATITKAVDESVASSISIQNDDELLFTPAVGGVYRFEIAIGVHAAGGVGIQWDMGLDTTVRGAVERVAVSGTTAVSAAAGVAFNVVNSTTGLTGFNDFAVLLWGFFTGVAALPLVDFHFRWAQGSSNVTPTIVKAGSTLKYRRIF